MNRKVWLGLGCLLVFSLGVTVIGTVGAGAIGRITIKGFVMAQDGEGSSTKDWLEPELTLSLGKLPLRDVRVRVNNIPVLETAPGKYYGVIFTTIKPGLRISIRVGPKPGQQNPTLSQEVEVASYVIGNKMDYIFPSPEQKIRVAPRLRYRFRWKFSQQTVPSEMRIYDSQTNQIVFLKGVSGDYQSILASTFQPGKRYHINQWVKKPTTPADYFKLASSAAPGSSVKFGSAYNLYFFTRQ